MMASALPNFYPFDIHADGATAQCWRKWIKRLEHLFLALPSLMRKESELCLFTTPEKRGDILET